MSRPRTVSDEAIKTAAREVFVAHGPSAPVSLVAARLGVSHAALFSRAGSKRQLMLDALCPGEPRAAARLEAEPPASAVHAALVDILTELMEFFRQVVPNLVVFRSAGRSMDELPSNAGPPPPIALRSALARWLEAAQAKGGCGPLDAAAAAEGLLGAMEARCFNAYLGGPAFAPGEDAAFVAELVDGLVPRANAEAAT